MSNSKFNVRLLTEIAFMAALAFIISLIPNTVYGWIIVEIACIPILILSFRRGLTAGLVGGLIWGILSMITGHAYILTLSQAFLEYLIAPVSLGIAGLFRQKTAPLKLAPVLLGTFVALPFYCRNHLLEPIRLERLGSRCLFSCRQWNQCNFDCYCCICHFDHFRQKIP